MEPHKKLAGIFNPEDVFIAVMGLTGAGKSSFIATCTGADVHIEHDLSSCTGSVAFYSMRHKGRIVHLIDTPGFNDTVRPESAIFKEIAYWLSKSQESGVLLNGIIYLHSIAEPRYTASAGRSLALLKAMCGSENYKSIILSTTFWNSDETQDQEVREKQLVTDFEKWGELKAGGSIVYSHSASETSALAMINHILQKNTKFTMAIQREISSGDIELNQTTAGRMMADFWREDIAKFERQLSETKLDIYREAAGARETARNSVQNLQDVIASRFADVAELNERRSELHRSWEANMRQDSQRLELAITHNQRAIEALREQRLAAQWSQDQEYAARDWYFEEEQLRQRCRYLQQEKMTRLAEWGLGVSVMSMISGGISAAYAVMPTAAAHAAVPLLVGAACSIM